MMVRGVFLVAVLLWAGTASAQIEDLKSRAEPVATNLPELAALKSGSASCLDGLADGFPCQNVDLVAFLPRSALGGARVNDLWGWEDPMDGRRYVVLGREDGVAFVDVTEPTQPRYLGQMLRTPGSRNSVWTDVKVYQNHAFVVADGAGAHGMQVFDLTQLRGLSGPPTTFVPAARYDGFGSAHNVVVNEETGFAYAVGSSGGSCGLGLHMIDIRQPSAPSFAGCFVDTRTRRGYTHDAQCVLYRGPDVAHQGQEVCVASNENAVSIVDVTVKSRPTPLGVATYPGASYVHQGWLSDDHRLFFQDDELDEGQGQNTRTMVWDVEDLDDPQLLAVFVAETQSIDHNLYVRGDYLYQANYTAGLQILDIRRPDAPARVGYFDTTPGDDSVGFNGAWTVYPYFSDGTLAVSSRSEGLFLLRAAHLLVNQLDAFDAAVNGREVRFTWTMGAQREVVRYDLERLSDDGSLWLPLTSTGGGGTKPSAQSFQTQAQLPPGRSLVRLVAVSATGATEDLAEKEIFVVPGTHVLSEVYPNPTFSTATMTLVVAEGQWLTVEAFNAAGAMVARLYDDRVEPDSELRLHLDASAWIPGTYFVRFSGREFSQMRTLVVTR